MIANTIPPRFTFPPLECSLGTNPRYAIIDKWQDRLSVVDVWVDSHCQAMVLYYIMH